MSLMLWRQCCRGGTMYVCTLVLGPCVYKTVYWVLLGSSPLWLWTDGNGFVDIEQLNIIAASLASTNEAYQLWMVASVIHSGWTKDYTGNHWSVTSSNSVTAWKQTQGALLLFIFYLSTVSLHAHKLLHFHTVSGGLICHITHSLQFICTLNADFSATFEAYRSRASESTALPPFTHSPLSPSAGSASTQPLQPPCLRQACPWTAPLTLSLSVYVSEVC